MYMKMKTIKHLLLSCLLSLALISSIDAQSAASVKPTRLAIAGMTHGHITFILGRKDKGDFVLTGVYEPNHEIQISHEK